MVTVWSKRAKLALQKAYEYIAKDSIQNATQVRNEIRIVRMRHTSRSPLK